jgi:hypothetical protein
MRRLTIHLSGGGLSFLRTSCWLQRIMLMWQKRHSKQIPLFILRKDKNAMATKSPRRTEPIPQLPAKPSLNELEEEDLVSRLMRLAHTYGPVFQLNLPQRQWVITANYALANELCDEQRFF